MHILDARTVMFSYAITSFICMILMAILWVQNRGKFAGLGFWLANFIAQFAGLVMIPLRGTAPDFLSTTFSNALIIGGAVLLYIGLEDFAGKRGPQLQNYLLLAAFLIVHSYFLYVVPSIVVRNVAFSLGLLAICSQSAWLMLKRTGPGMREMSRGVGYVFAGFCLTSIVRIVVDLTAPPENDFFRSNVYVTSLLITYQMLYIVLTLSLLLLVNRLLFADLESDIAARRRAEESIRLRLRLWEFAAAHTVEELMQNALDEIERLSDSLIGFYHFADEEKKSVSLKAWSSRTLAEFCKAEGEGMHYPLDQAGVWADCVRQRRAVIHNDYASLPQRKGLPPGHAEVVRELVVPTMRDGRVVAILGVGNKRSDYDQQDVEQVAYIADIVWSIVEHKRAEEQIRRLNGELERLAMTDELTGLANRRLFFIRGTEEINRARRYQTPLSLIMLDIDEFKKINDTYGHEAGDVILQCVAGTLREKIRGIDVVARVGGEEFCVLLPNTDVEAAAKLADRLMQSVGKKDCPIERDRRMNVTASVGVAAYSVEMSDLDSLLRDADAAMYQAKNQGRNRVVTYRPGNSGN